LHVGTELLRRNAGEGKGRKGEKRGEGEEGGERRAEGREFVVFPRKTKEKSAPMIGVRGRSLLSTTGLLDTAGWCWQYRSALRR